MPKPLLPDNFRLTELLVRRGLAFLWDSILPALPCAVLLRLRPDHPSWIGWVFLACFFAYESVVLARFDGGWGKRLAGLEVRTLEGHRLPAPQAVVRTAVKTACLSPLFVFTHPNFGPALTLGLFLAPYLFLEEHCFLHDLRTDSRVNLRK